MSHDDLVDSLIEEIGRMRDHPDTKVRVEVASRNDPLPQRLWWGLSNETLHGNFMIRPVGNGNVQDSDFVVVYFDPENLDRYYNIPFSINDLTHDQMVIFDDFRDYCFRCERIERLKAFMEYMETPEDVKAEERKNGGGNLMNRLRESMGLPTIENIEAESDGPRVQDKWVQDILDQMNPDDFAGESDNGPN